ncbi:MAG TPA: RIP metalloprotease RseP [Bacteroidia bacterium]|jgi:regulator of sigma E protease|nr:RIP metalloprotease RseP [Bacteroidia bacterium]MCC7513256.1 RIP metalloprotease RseP [Bacteroidia bacterium]HMY13247.1 RIP metalloprotease RseP [Bacteroidia bacterium]HMY63069.1 RIP metalloprotease RseP [Bacteroidia bacterium]HND70469.1 RIP metalloprotease RseP [Bacteroidia bacterium]
MSGLIMAAQLILGLSILVTLHELGHFLAARMFGIKVEKFYLFFDAWGIKLFSFKKGDCEYGIGWLPFGGYVKIAGMVDESMDKDQLAQPAQPWEFRSKPAWQRLIVMVAGVVMNVILGIAIFSMSLLHYKGSYLKNDSVTHGIVAYKLGEEIGLRTGDKVVAIDGKSFDRFDDLLSTRVLFGATLTVIRNGETIPIEVPDDFYKKTGPNARSLFLGAGHLTYVVKEVVVGENAFKAGVENGDIITEVDKQKITGEDFMQRYFADKKGETALLSIIRNGKPMDITVNISSKGTIGVRYNGDVVIPEEYIKTPYTLSSALAFGTSDAFETLVSNAKGFKKLFKGEEKFQESVQGPIGIAKIYGGTWDWPHFWVLTGLLSMILAFMNILPIPALDGGHVLFLLIESVTRKKFSDAFMEKTQVVGMVLLLSLMVFVIGNDIWRAFIK